MNEAEVNALLQVYQQKVTNLQAQNIQLESQVLVLRSQIQLMQQQPKPPADAGEFESASVPEPAPKAATPPRRTKK